MANPLLQYVLHGVCRHPLSHPRPPRMPMTPEILHLLLATWSAWPEESRQDASMLWLAGCLGFLGFFYGLESSPVLHGKLSDHTSSLYKMCLWTRATTPPWCRFGYANDPFGAGVTWVIWVIWVTWVEQGIESVQFQLCSTILSRWG